MASSSADADSLPKTTEKPAASEQRDAPQNRAPQAPAGGPNAGFFGWVKPAISKRRTLKTWTRSLLVLAGTLVLLVVNPSLRSMGQAGFFASIIAILLPPSFALSFFILAVLTLLVGMLLGWAWGAAAMASALHVQDQALLVQRITAFRQAAAASNSTAAASAVQLQEQIFHGYFLDTGVSAVYGVFFFIGTLVMGVVRARVPRLVLTGIFGTIVLDVMCTIGPLLPSANYTVAKQFLIPACYYVAIAVASLILIFPESANHVWLTTVDTAFFGPASAILAIQSDALHSQPSDHAKWATGVAKSAAARAGLSARLAGLSAQIGLIDMEISMGRLGPADLRRLSPEIRALGFRAAGLLAFQTAVSDIHVDDKKDAAARSLAPSPDGTPKLSAHETRFSRRRRVMADREAAHGHALDDLVPILASSSKPLRNACEEGMKRLKVWLNECDSGRWTTLVKKRSAEDIEKSHAALVGVTDSLEAALKTWRVEGRVELIKPYERFFDPGTGKLKPEFGAWGNKENKEMFAVRSLFICFVFCDSIDVFAARLHRVLALAVDLDTRRPHPRLWFPSGLGKTWRKITSRAPTTAGENPLTLGTERNPAVFDEDEAEAESEPSSGDASETAVETAPEDEKARPPARKNPDARAPTSFLGKLSVRLGSFLHFFATDEGIFALRHALLSLALWIPAVVPSSAWFYYSNKGLWALIMGQMALATYAGDQLASIATRIVGTGLGLLLGLVIWYISAPGLKTGTRTRSWLLRPRSSLQLSIFVVGFSWIDAHLAILPGSSQGVGINLGWRRAVLVIVGFVAAGIMMLFPRPSSGRVLVRRTLAASLQELGCLFGLEVEAFLAEEAKAKAGHVEREQVDYLDEQPSGTVSAKEKRVRKVSGRILTVMQRLQGLAPSLATARWEPQVQGLWPYEQYQFLHQKTLKLATSIALLGGAFSKLDPTWCSILVERTPFLNPSLLSDIFSTIDILSHALQTGCPIPASLPLLRERLLLYHETLIRALYHTKKDEPALAMPEQRGDSEADTNSEDTDDHATELVAGKVDGASIGFEQLSLSVLMDEQLPTHSTAVVALSSILSALDDIAAIVRELCGEKTFTGFDALQHEYMGRDEAAIGTRR
ncbi:hypothetical protein MKEN_00268300 [Mycena kentingensis (nom. inval.)]|nr:hypothetical protein MKEN_00268300 [Mycena kentingensis (nom. inval.)]